VTAGDGAPVPAEIAGAEAAHAGPRWSPAHVTLLRASFGASGTTYSEVGQVELGRAAEERGTGT